MHFSKVPQLSLSLSFFFTLHQEEEKKHTYKILLALIQFAEKLTGGVFLNKFRRPTAAVWRLSRPRPVGGAVSVGQARCLEALPARVGHRAAEGDAVAEDDPAVRRRAGVSTGHG